MNKKIHEKILKEVKPREYLVEYEDHGKPFQVYEKLFTKQDIERTIELMEEEDTWENSKAKWFLDGTKEGEKQKEAEFRKMIDEEKKIVQKVCLGLAHPSQDNQKEFTKWLQDTVNFHLSQLLAKLNDSKK